MGLLTGFSILSGVEIVYFLLRWPGFCLPSFIAQVFHVAPDSQIWGVVWQKILGKFGKKGLKYGEKKIVFDVHWLCTFSKTIKEKH